MWLRKTSSIKKIPISKVESFLKSNFWPKPIMQKCQKIEVCRRLGRVKTKNVLAQTIPDKIFGTE